MTSIQNNFLPTKLYGGSADNIFEKLKSEPTEKKIHLCKRLAQGIVHAHRKGYVHGDIKPQNILFRNNNNKELAALDIGDWGGSRTKSNAAYVAATPNYAPDVILFDLENLEFETIQRWMSTLFLSQSYSSFLV